MSAVIQSRNQREGRYCGKWRRRHRRDAVLAVSDRVGPYANKPCDYTVTRRERRAERAQRNNPYAGSYGDAPWAEGWF